MTTDRSAFLAKIALEPDDDTARLVFADWLQENNEDDLAEFIRVQVELARLAGIAERMGFKNVANSGGPNYDRESALLAAHPEWLPKCPMCDGKGEVEVRSEARGAGKGGWWAPCMRCSGTGRVGVCRRGFCDEVPVRLGDVLFEAVRSDTGVYDSHTGSQSTAFSLWRPTKWAKGVVENFPLVTRMPVTDRTPFQAYSNNGWFWIDTNASVEGDGGIENVLWRTDFLSHDDKETGRRKATRFDTQSAANDALALAVVSVIRGA